MPLQDDFRDYMARTSGWSIARRREFFASLNGDTQAFILAHALLIHQLTIDNPPQEANHAQRI